MRYHYTSLVATIVAFVVGLPVASLAGTRSSSTRMQQTNAKALIIDRYIQQVSRPARQNSDTVHRPSRIVSIMLENDVLTIRLDVADNQSWMEITLYNMLGKRIKEIYRGPVQADDSIREWSVSISDLPNGLYILSVQGSNVRLADKVLISR